MTADPLPGTPAKQVLLQAGYSDHQVTNLAAEVEARTIGATRIASDLPVCRHWARDPMFGFAPHDPGVAEPAVLAYFDSGTPRAPTVNRPSARGRSEEHTSELQSLMRISYAVFCLKKKKHKNKNRQINASK